LAKNCTLAIVPVAAVAVAVTVLEEPAAISAPPDGEEMDTLGSLPPETVTEMVDEVVVAPRLSVTTAVSE
jgi:hypothetical protein